MHIVARGIHELEDSGLGAISEVLGRHPWESWAVSLYALLGGDEALQVLKADDVYWKRSLVKRLEVATGYQEEWNGVPARMSMKRVTEKLRPLLAKSERTDVLDQKALGYEAAYSFQSLFSAHANLSTIGIYLCHSTNDWNVAPVVSTFSMPSLETTEGIPVILVAHLAKHVFRAFGLPVENIESIGRMILIPNEGTPRD